MLAALDNTPRHRAIKHPLRNLQCTATIILRQRKIATPYRPIAPTIVTVRPCNEYQR